MKVSLQELLLGMLYPSRSARTFEPLSGSQEAHEQKVLECHRSQGKVSAALLLFQVAALGSGFEGLGLRVWCLGSVYGLRAKQFWVGLCVWCLGV